MAEKEETAKADCQDERTQSDQANRILSAGCTPGERGPLKFGSLRERDSYLLWQLCGHWVAQASIERCAQRHA